MTPTLFPAFDETHFDNVLSRHLDLHGVTYRRRAEEGEDQQQHVDGDGFVTVHADWDNVKETLKEFNVLLRNLYDFNQGLLSFTSTARSLWFATLLANETTQLRDELNDLHLFIYTYIVKMQEAWFDREDFNQFTKSPFAVLVLHHPSGDRPKLEKPTFTKHVDRISEALGRLDEIAASALAPRQILQPLFDYLVASHRGVPIPDPKWYPRNYPLLTIIKACNYWMPAMTEVFERWTEIGIRSLICGRDYSESQSRRRGLLQLIACNAAIFSYTIAIFSQLRSPLQLPPTLETLYSFLWLLSLVLSVAAMMQSLHAIYLRPSTLQKTPKGSIRVVTLGAPEVPLGLLGASFVTFMFGIVHFAYQVAGKGFFVVIATTVVAILVYLAVFVFMILREHHSAK